MVMKCEIEIDMEWIRIPMPYKYFIFSKQHSAYENLDNAISITGYFRSSPVHINRCLIVYVSSQIPGGKRTY